MEGFRIGLSGCGGGLESVSSPELMNLAELAEVLDFDGLWINEEHFQGSALDSEGRRCLSPLILAAAILARTERIRVGFSVLLLPLHHHPIRLAEEIATLDVLSNGRVDFGAHFRKSLPFSNRPSVEGYRSSPSKNHSVTLSPEPKSPTKREFQCC